MVILKANSIYKEFDIDGNIVKVLNGINVEIEKGKFVSIMGQSGSGKSTLLYVLSALEKPTRGNVYFDGKDISILNDSQISKVRRNKFGFIFQFYNLIPTLTVEENITLPLELDGVNKKSYKEELTGILNKVGLTEKRNSFPYQLSGGQQQRVAIARALIINPKIIFADEPTGNLDSRTGEEILNLLKFLSEKEGKTILMVTHDNNAALFSDRIISIRDGMTI